MHASQFFSLLNAFIIIINISYYSSPTDTSSTFLHLIPPPTQYRCAGSMCTQQYLRNTIYNSNNARGVVIVYVKKLIFSGDCGIFNIRISYKGGAAACTQPYIPAGELE